MVTLNISQQFGKIGLQITPFQYELKIKPPDLSVQQTPASVSLEQAAVTLNIDYTPAREAIGYAGIVANQQQFDRQAEAAYDAGVQRRVQEGAEAASLKDHIPLGKILAAAMPAREKQLTLVPVPPIRITVQEQPMQWDVVDGGVAVNLTPGTVQGNLQYGQVNVYQEQKSSVQIQAVGAIWDKGI